jgi:outer membrane usher protein
MLSGFVRLTDRLGTSLSLGVSRGPRGSGCEAHVGVTLAAPRNHTVTMAASRNTEREATLSAGVQRSLPIGEGYGYRLQMQEGATRSVTGGVQAQTRYGRVDATADNFDGSQQSSLGVAGAVAFAAGGVHFTRTIDDAFAVIKVPGQPNVRTYVDGQLVGRTNGRGELVVPHLLSYHDNSITIAGDDVPLDANVESGERIISPGLRNGPSVTFAASRTQRIMGRVRRSLAGTATAPLNGDLVLTDGTLSPLGRDGQFYFENLPAGTIDGRVMFEGITYQCQLEIPASSQSRLVLHDIVCQQIEGRQP